MNIARQDHMVAINSAGNRSDGSGDLRIDRADLSQRRRRAGRLHAGRGSFQGWEVHPGCAIHCCGGKHFQSRPDTEGRRGGCNPDTGRYPLRGDRIWHLLSPWEKACRERAMELIGIAHPKFRPSLIEKAKQLGLIYSDQAFIAGSRGEYPSI